MLSERLEDDVGCSEGADASGGLGVADGCRAVAVGLAGLPDVDGGVGVVDVVPGESGGFAGSESDVEHEDPHCFAVGAAGGGEEVSGLSDGECFAGVGGGEFGEGGDVSGGVVTPLGHYQTIGTSNGRSTAQPGATPSQCFATRRARLALVVGLGEDPDTWTVDLTWDRCMALFWTVTASALSLPPMVLAVRAREDVLTNSA